MARPSECEVKGMAEKLSIFFFNEITKKYEQEQALNTDLKIMLKLTKSNCFVTVWFKKCDLIKAYKLECQLIDNENVVNALKYLLVLSTSGRSCFKCVIGLIQWFLIFSNLPNPHVIMQALKFHWTFK